MKTQSTEGKRIEYSRKKELEGLPTDREGWQMYAGRVSA